jgi:alpha-L-fucosidase
VAPAGTLIAMSTSPHASHFPDGDTAWFTDARFGLFIHWGLCSMAARHEW